MKTKLLIAFRSLVKRPTFTTTAIMTMGLGIGLNTTVFTIVDRLLLKRSPYKDSSRLVVIHSSTSQSETLPLSPADFCDIRDGNSVFENITAYCPAPASLVEKDQLPIQVRTMGVSANFFKTLGVAPIVGRSFTIKDELARMPELILSFGFWKNHFFSDPSIIGRILRIDGRLVTVVGVMPESMDDPLLWGPKDLWTLDFPDINRNLRDRAWYRVTARLNESATLDEAKAQIASISARLAADYKATEGGKLLVVEPSRLNQIDLRTRKLCWLSLSVTSAILAIACMNLANLQLVRSVSRENELATRRALGASWKEIYSLQLLENLYISTVGAALGILFAEWGNLAAEKYLKNYFPVEFKLNVKVAAFAFVVSVVLGVICSVISGWQLARVDTAVILKKNVRGSTPARSTHAARQLFIILELSLTIIIISGAGYFFAGTQRMLGRNLGWNPENVLSGELVLPSQEYGDAGDERSVRFADLLKAKIAQHSGVEHVAIAYTSPIWGYASGGAMQGVSIAGSPIPEDKDAPQVHLNAVTPSFFATIGVHLVRGRDFTDSDNSKAPNVAIINLSLANKCWPNQDPIGKRIGNTDRKLPNWSEVVGIVNDTVTLGNHRANEINFELYRPFAQEPSRWINFLVRTAVDPNVFKEVVRKDIAYLEPTVALAWFETASDEMANSVRVYVLVNRTLLATAIMGALLTVIGLYGVVETQAKERTREIGIRMALGATPLTVLRFILKEGTWITVIGIGVGTAIELVVRVFLKARFPEIPGDDISFLIASPLFIGVVSLIASLIPAVRAIKVNPSDAIRAE